MLFTGSGGHRAAAFVDACPSLKTDEQRTQRIVDACPSLKNDERTKRNLDVLHLCPVCMCVQDILERGPTSSPHPCPPGSKFS